MEQFSIQYRVNGETTREERIDGPLETAYQLAQEYSALYPRAKVTLVKVHHYPDEPPGTSYVWFLNGKYQDAATRWGVCAYGAVTNTSAPAIYQEGTKRHAGLSILTRLS